MYPDDAYTDLGWANSWTVDPPALERCKAQGHRLTSAKMMGSVRGHETVYWCTECVIKFFVDSSD